MIYQPAQQQYMGMGMPQAQYSPMQNSLINVRGEQEARNYPTAHGASLTFKDENGPYLYTKTLGMSQMDVPVFEKFRLERVEDSPQDGVSMAQGHNTMPTVDKGEIDALKAQIEGIKKDVKDLMDFKAEFGGDSDA